MSLATRCPQCQTVFRVVQDQLRVSEGWVRCGRCAEVFNASQHLVDAATGESRRAPAEAQAGLPPAPGAHDVARDTAATTRTAIAPTGTPAAAPRDSVDFEIDEAGFPVTQVPLDDDALLRLAPSDDADAEPARPAASTRAAPRAAPAAAGARSGRSGRPGARGDLPSFVRRAQRSERWRRPGMRALLGAAVLIGAAALAAQWLYVYRDEAAARWPAARPWLASTCAALGCRIEALRAIDALVVESSALVRVEQSELYRLNLALRNRRELDIALPAFDLSLTDLQGRLIARRVLRAADLGAAGVTLPARSELALQATIQVAAAPVAGYTIELFYP